MFVAFEVAGDDIAHALDGVRALGLAGLSVTMPHKTKVAHCVDRLTDTASVLDAVNCVYLDGDELVGDNTDGEGFMRALVGDTGFVPDGRRCVVLGAGGAARAVAVALARGEPASVLSADLVVNATPVGMRHDAGSLPIDANLIREGQVVVDLIYEPRETALMTAARERGAVVANGLGMLVGQAAVAFELWTGLAAPVDVMARAASPASD